MTRRTSSNIILSRRFELVGRKKSDIKPLHALTPQEVSLLSELTLYPFSKVINPAQQLHTEHKLIL